MTWFRSLFYALKQISLKLCIVTVNSSIDWPNVPKENNSKLLYKFIKRNQIVYHAHMKADSESFNLYILMKKGDEKIIFSHQWITDKFEYKCFTLDIVFSIHEPKFLVAMMCSSSKKGPNIHTGRMWNPAVGDRKPFTNTWRKSIDFFKKISKQYTFGQ